MNHSSSRRSFFQKPFHGQNGTRPGIGGLPLEKILAEYRAELFNRFVPGMDRFVIDDKYGGFMCDYDIREKKQVSSVKKTWSEGRGIYIYAAIYNRIKKDASYLEVAKKSLDFILAQLPPGGSWWNASFTREGKPLPGEGDIYCDLYLAEGLVEFGRASGEKKYTAQAKQLLTHALQVYDSNEYHFPVSYGPSSAEPVNAPRVVGHWMVFLRAASLFLEYTPDEQISALASRCVDALLHKHMNPRYGLLNETLRHDFTLPPGKWANFGYLATALQSLWMVMAEAIRTKNKILFEESGRAFKKHLLAAADPVYGGFFRSLDDVAANIYKTDKVLSLQQEVMNGCLLLSEYADDEWAKTVFAQTFHYIKTSFYHPEYSFPVEAGDRTMRHYTTRGVGNYHHPRHLILTLLSLERMTERRATDRGMFNDVKI